MALPSNWPKWFQDTWATIAVMAGIAVVVIGVRNAAVDADVRSKDNAGAIQKIQRHEAGAMEWRKGVSKQLDRIEKKLDK